MNFDKFNKGKLIVLKICFAALFSLTVFPLFSQNLWTIDNAIDNYIDGIVLHRIPQGRDVAVLAFGTHRRSIMTYFIDTMQEKLWEKGSNVWIYDRYRLESMQNQLGFSLSSTVGDDTARRIGEFLNADIVIYGGMERTSQSYRMDIFTGIVETGEVLFPRSYDLRIDSKLAQLLMQFDIEPVVYDQDQNQNQETEVIILPEPDVVIVERRMFPEPWQNKWLYLRATFDFPVFVYQQSNDWALNPSTSETSTVNSEYRFTAGFTIGLEFQFLNWMSTELDLLLRYGDPRDFSAFVLGLGLQLKFPIKPSNLFMLEPYVMANALMNTSNEYLYFPPLGLGGGFQFAIKSPGVGAFLADLHFLYTPQDVHSKNPRGEGWTPERFSWTRYTIGLGIGYKIGFIDR